MSLACIQTACETNTAATATIVMGSAAIPWLEGVSLAARLVTTAGDIVRIGGWPEPAVERADAAPRNAAPLALPASTAMASPRS